MYPTIKNREDAALEKMPGQPMIDVSALIQSSELHEVVRHLSTSAVVTNDRATLGKVLKQLEGRAVDETLLKETDHLVGFFHPGLKKVACTNIDRAAAPDELVFIFGNYPPSFGGLIINNPIRRNVLDFKHFEFDSIESNQCWDQVSRIFIINRDDRPDRFYSCLRELARMEAPFQRITRFSACVDPFSQTRLGRLALKYIPKVRNKRLHATIGCLRSHLTIIQTAQEQGLDNVLVLEDDFCFTDDIQNHQDSLRQFFDRRYAFDICLLSTSKHGLIVPNDDLTSFVRQPVTSTSGYFVSREGMPKLAACFSEALRALVKSGDTERFAADRCWTELQGDRFLVFKDRLGFQSPSYSDIEGGIAAYFD